MIDCLLIYPKPTHDSPKEGLALGIFYCGASLEREGFSVEYFDSRFDDKRKLEDIIEKKRPLAVGISTMTGYQLLEAKQMLTYIKNRYPRIYTIMGGVHPSLMPVECLKEGFVDFVIVGEGEFALLNLIRELKGKRRFKGVESLCWKDNGRLIRNKRSPFINLATLPFPLTKKTERYYAISAGRDCLIHPTSRSCSHFCGYCYNLIVNKSQWRTIPLDKWISEFNKIADSFKFSHMFTGDDNIGKDKERINKIGETFKKKNITWHTNIRPEYLDKELVGILDKYGCTSLLLGFESGSDRVLNKVIRKGLPNGAADLRRCAELLGKSRIKAIYSFMSNLPTETLDELKVSMDLADYIKRVDKGARISFNVYAPYPGTTLYKMALNGGFREPKSMEEWSKINLSNTINPIAENLYYISGLSFRGSKGDNTSVNFPGLKRLIILPFEILAKTRWKIRLLKFYAIEKLIVKFLFKWATDRANKISREKQKYE